MVRPLPRAGPQPGCLTQPTQAVDQHEEEDAAATITVTSVIYYKVPVMVAKVVGHMQGCCPKSKVVPMTRGGTNISHLVTCVCLGGIELVEEGSRKDVPYARNIIV